MIKKFKKNMKNKNTCFDNLNIYNNKIINRVETQQRGLV